MKTFFAVLSVVLFFAGGNARAAENACAQSVIDAAAKFPPPAEACTQSFNESIGKCVINAFPTPETAPECKPGQKDDNARFGTAPSYSGYDKAVLGWSDTNDPAGAANAWIGANFSYDIPRAKQSPSPTPYSPETLYRLRSGICADLAVFAKSTLATLDTSAKTNYGPQFLKINFEPCSLGKKILTYHWMVQFQKDGKLYFMADTKYPGQTFGPCNTQEEFLNAYQQIRCRQVRCWGNPPTVGKEIKPAPGKGPGMRQYRKKPTSK